MESDNIKKICRDHLSDYFIYVYKTGQDVSSDGDEVIYMRIPKGGAKQDTNARCILNRKEKTIKMHLDVFKKYAPYLLDFEVNLSNVSNTIRYVYIDTKGRYVVDGSKFKMYPIVVYDNASEVLKEDDLNIFLGLLQKNDTVSKVKCHFNEKDGVLKIPFKTFKKFAYYLRDYKIDLSGVNSETKEVTINSKHQVEVSGKNINKNSGEELYDLLADPDVKLVYANGENMLHDKTCEHINHKMQLKDCTKNGPKGYHLCPACKYKILIRAHMQSDDQKFLWYVKFFRNIVSLNAWKEAFSLNSDLELLDVGENFVVLKTKSDTWEIKHSGGLYHLFHNNYTVNTQGERVFMDGFHKQGRESNDLTKIISYVYKYSWNVNHMTTPVVVEESVEHISVFKKVWIAIANFFGVKTLKKSA